MTDAPDADRAAAELPAGEFSAWLRRALAARGGTEGVDVPCGGCNACCRSAYFIHVEPDETETLSRIPGELLFPAPGRPDGHVLLGYDEHGQCPMLVDGRCSIYSHRPRTCREFDCRIFPATGLAPGDGAKAPIDRQARRWKFRLPSERDTREFAAVRAAAEFLRAQAARFPAGFVPSNPTQLAVLAIAVHEVFLQRAAAADRATLPDAEIARAVIAIREKFEDELARRAATAA